MRTVETRRLYYFEDAFKKTAPRYLVQPRSMRYLRKFTVKVWKSHGRGGSYMPDVRAIDSKDSYSIGFLIVKLDKKHRNIMMLLHELTHSFGPFYHGASFVRTYVRLLVKYGRLNESELVIGMGMFGIRVPVL